jgi:hypothetical protein
MVIASNFQPGWNLPGYALEELLTIVPIDMPVQDHRPIDEVRHDHGRDLVVIVDQVALGVAVLRPKDLREIGQMQGVGGGKLEPGTFYVELGWEAIFEFGGTFPRTLIS